MTIFRTNRAFRYDLIGQSFSQFGDILFFPAMIAFISQFPNPEFLLVLASLSEALPIFISPLLGAYADTIRSHVRWLHLSNGVRALLYLFASFILLVQPHISVIFILLAINFTSDLAGRINRSLSLGLTLEYIPHEQLQAAQAEKNMLTTLNQFVGLAIGGSLLLFLNFSQLAFFNALTFCIPSLFMLITKRELLLAQQQANENKTTHAQISTRESFLSGWHFVMNFPFLRVGLIIAAAINFFAMPLLNLILPLYITEFPALVIDNVAFTIAVVNLAALGGIFFGSLASKYLTKFPPIPLLLISVATVGIIYFTFTIQPTIFILGLAFVLAGFAIGIVNVIFTSVVMRAVPKQNVGTVVAFTQLFANGATIFSSMLLASIIAFTNLPSALFLGGICIMLLLFGLIIFSYQSSLLFVQNHEYNESE